VDSVSLAGCLDLFLDSSWEIRVWSAERSLQDFEILLPLDKILKELSQKVNSLSFSKANSNILAFV